MARAVEWTEAAASDLSDAAEFVGRDSPLYSKVLVREARDAAASLRDFPERARLVPEAHRSDVRELFVQGHRLIFQVAPSKLLVLAFASCMARAI